MLFPVCDEFDDQIMLFVLLRRTRLPLLLMVSCPYESVSGLFLFATHITALGAVLYHIPKYLLLDFPGEKKPNSKVWPEESSVLPSVMDCVRVMKSAAWEKLVKIRKEDSEVRRTETK